MQTDKTLGIYYILYRIDIENIQKSIELQNISVRCSMFINSARDENNTRRYNIYYIFYTE